MKRIFKPFALALILVGISTPAMAHDRDAAYIPGILYAVDNMIAPPPARTVVVYQTVPQNVVVYRETRVLPPPARVIYITPDKHRGKPYYVHDHRPHDKRGKHW